MMIMNQRRDALLNVDHIKKLEATRPLPRRDSEGEITEIAATDRNGAVAVLGRYASLDRAKAVLLEIAQEYGKYLSTPGGPCLTVEAYVQPMAFEPPKVYMMPEE